MKASGSLMIVAAALGFSLSGLAFAPLAHAADQTSDQASGEVRIGSKAFTEGFLLAEIAARTIESSEKFKVVRKFGLGNTGILFQALENSAIDLYPEYTGTISEALLKDNSAKTISEISRKLEPYGLVISKSLGFNNTYAIAVTKKFAALHGVSKLSDLKRVEDVVRPVLSHEFVSRADGFPSLAKTYGLSMKMNRQSLEHSLAYEAVANGSADLIDVYSTDPKIPRLNLVVLEDDRHHFPVYEAVWLARKDFIEAHPDVWKRLTDLEGTISEEDIRALNSKVEIDRETVSDAAAAYLKILAESDASNRAARFWLRTKEHLALVGITLLFSMLVGIPLGIFAAKFSRAGQTILLLSSLVQTIPSLALLCFLIPVFGIGMVPALVALFLYSLLPVLTNTYTGLRSIDENLIETANALGLSRGRRLFSIELPLASPSILAGVRTATIISIGTATLAALIGAGGYGAPIVSGLAMNDTGMILTGAVPAAALALLAHLCFEAASRILVPKGLRL